MENINGISTADVKTRLEDINKETPILWTTSLIKSPQEITARTAVRNNLLLDKVLDNQNKIMQNQSLIMERIGIGEKLDVQA